MMVRVVLHHHLHAVQLLRHNHAGMVVRERERRKRKQQVRGLFQILVDAIGRTNQKDNIPRKTVAQRVGELYRIHEFALFRQNNTAILRLGELLFKECRLLGERLHAVIELGFLEFHNLEREHSAPQALHVLFHLVRDKRRTGLTKNCENPFHGISGLH